MLLRLLAVLALCLSPAGAARAETQVFQATFSLVGLADPPPAATAIGVATINSSGGGSHLATLRLPGDILSLHTTVPIAATFPLRAVRLDLTLDGGTFGVNPLGTLTGALPVPGIARMCLLLDCESGFDVPLTELGTRGVGIGGAAITRLLGFGTLSLVGGLWGTGRADVQTSLGSVGLTGFAHGPLSATSSTADPQGVLQLVTPVSVGLAQQLGTPPVILPVFGVLEVKLLPEPGTAAALAAGGALLVFLGARRARR